MLVLISTLSSGDVYVIISFLRIFHHVRRYARVSWNFISFCASDLSELFAAQSLFVVKFTIHTILPVSLWMCVLCVYKCVWMCTNVFWVVYLTLETARLLQKNQIIRFHKTMTLLHLWNILSSFFFQHCSMHSPFATHRLLYVRLFHLVVGRIFSLIDCRNDNER